MTQVLHPTIDQIIRVVHVMKATMMIMHLVDKVVHVVYCATISDSTCPVRA
jgi:hypothetical protein